MEQLHEKKKLKGFKKFLYETFRPHTKEEYCTFLMRGMVKGADGEDREYKPYPFVYMRAFVALFFLFSITVWIMLATGIFSSFVTAVLFGALVVNVPCLILLYELYPLKDFSPLTLISVLIIGGWVSVSLAQILYAVLPYEEGISYPFYIGFVEELSKALPAIIAILILRKRTPYAGLLIGCAVGMGFSAIEDTAYIMDGASGAGFDSAGMMLVVIVRAITSVFGHISWTGFIGWAFNKYKKSYRNFKFYFIAGLSVLAHALWDFQLAFEEDTLAVLLFIPCSIFALCMLISILKKERKLIYLAVCPQRFYVPPANINLMHNKSAYNALRDPFGFNFSQPFNLAPNGFDQTQKVAYEEAKAPAEGEQLEIPGLPAPACENAEAEKEEVQPECTKIALIASIILGLCMFIISCCGVVFGFGYVDWNINDYREYGTLQEFITAVQGNKQYTFDINRKYKNGIFDGGYNDAVIEDKRIVKASQVENKNGYSIVYWYEFDYGTVGDGKSTLTDIVLKINGVEYGIQHFGFEEDEYCAVFGIDTTGGRQNGEHFFICDDKIAEAYYDDITDEYVAVRSNIIYTGYNTALVLYITAGVAAAGAAISVALLVIDKKRRNKNA